MPCTIFFDASFFPSHPLLWYNRGLTRSTCHIKLKYFGICPLINVQITFFGDKGGDQYYTCTTNSDAMSSSCKMAPSYNPPSYPAFDPQFQVLIPPKIPHLTPDKEAAQRASQNNGDSSFVDFVTLQNKKARRASVDCIFLCAK